jgi:16S rRNA C1402 (ribose-2'-O) methylase RsmI
MTGNYGPAAAAAAAAAAGNTTGRTVYVGNLPPGKHQRISTLIMLECANTYNIIYAHRCLG